MPDEPQTPPATGDAAEVAAAAAAAAATEKDEAALGTAGKAALDAERKARRDAEKRAADAEKKAKEYEDRDLSEQQKLEKRAQEAEGKLPTLEVENLRLRIAVEKKLPVELIDRLKGSTKEEIAADADELLKLVKGNGASGSSFDGGARGDAPATDMDTLIRQRAGIG